MTESLDDSSSSNVTLSEKEDFVDKLEEDN